MHLESEPLCGAAESLRRYIVEFSGGLLERQIGAVQPTAPAKRGELAVR